MNPLRSLPFFALLGLSGVSAYLFFSNRNSGPETTSRHPELSQRMDAPVAPRARTFSPLLLDEPRHRQIDPTNYEVTVSDLSLEDIGQKIETEARTRLQDLTDRYQLSVNQRREAFPLIVSHHPDHTPGLVVNGFSSLSPENHDFATQFSEILDLNQRELFQEDLGSDRAWWRDILTQIREDIDGTPPLEDPGNSMDRPDIGDHFGD